MLETCVKMTDRGINTSRKQQARGSWARYCLYQDIVSDSHDVTLLIDGAQAFSAMIEAIEGAKKTVLMDSYIFNDDSVGKMFAAALGERAKAGVAVYLIVDGFGTINVPASFFQEEVNEAMVVSENSIWRLIHDF